MPLLELLLKDLDGEIILYDKNEWVIAKGKANALLDLLGCHLLFSHVIKNNKIRVYIDISLGGDE